MSTVTVTDFGNFSAAPDAYMSRTVPLQPCVFHNSGRHPEATVPPLWYMTRVTLKTTVVVPRSDTVVSWPSPPPADKTTATPVDSSNTSENPAVTTPAPGDVPNGAPDGAPRQTTAQTDVSSLTFKDLPASSKAQGQTIPTPIKVTVGGIPITISPSSVNIGGQSFGNQPSPQPVTVGGQTFTINPSQIIGPETTINRPRINGNPIFPKTVAGVTFAIGPSVAIIAGSTFAIGPGAQPHTIQVGRQTISVGSDGVGFPQTTVPPAPAPSPPITIGGVTVTAFGSSEAVADGTTFKLGPGSATQTEVINGQTLILGPNGVVLTSTTIGGPSNSESTQVATQGGLQISQVGPDLVAIQGTTFNIGPGAPPITETIDGQKVSIGPDGIGVGSTTVHAPFALPTSVVTVGGVTIRESGTIARVGDRTFTIGPKATKVTATVNGQIITIGPSGVSIDTTTIPAPSNPSATVVFAAGAITFSEVGSTLAIIGQDTFTVGPQATPTRFVQNGQTISIGPSGVAIGSTTIKAPFSPPTTSILTVGGVTFSEVGSTLAVIGGKTYTVGPQAVSTTAVFDSKTVSIGTNGLVIGSSTISAPFIPLETKTFTVGSITVSEVGSTLAVIASSTFTIGPHAPRTTKVIDGQTVSLGPDGIVFASTTIPYLPTKLVTAAGITFTEIGSTIAIIGGSTFTIGPGARPTTDIYNGQTISLGPGGIGFRTTTLNSFMTSTSTEVTSTDNMANTAPSQQTGVASPQEKNEGERMKATWLLIASISLFGIYLL